MFESRWRCHCGISVCQWQTWIQLFSQERSIFLFFPGKGGGPMLSFRQSQRKKRRICISFSKSQGWSGPTPSVSSHAWTIHVSYSPCSLIRLTVCHCFSSSTTDTSGTIINYLKRLFACFSTCYKLGKSG